MNHNILTTETVTLNERGDALQIIDQTKLPYQTEVIELKDQESIWDAIYLLKVRGAPAIGVAAGIGIYLAAKDIDTEDYSTFYTEFKKAKDYLDSSRPTAVNLAWALNRMEQVVLENREKSVAEIKELLREKCIEIKEEDTWVCRKIGEYGLSLLQKKDAGILTHCNAGKLAATKYGTATAPIYVGQEQGYNFKVFCDETRPLLQGARLTAYELHESGIDTTLICDNMAPMVMKNGWVDAVFVGCDRVARNGDTANKIGTSYVSLAAKNYNVPFYVCAPTSTIDMMCETGAGIPIEERSEKEITEMWYEKRMAPKGVKTFNPAFDVTDAQNITAIITEYGIATAPFEKSFEEIFARKKEAEEAKKRGE